MRTISGPLAAHLAQPCTTLCILLTVTLTNATVFRYVNLDQDIVFGGHTYGRSNSFAISSIQVVLGTSTSSCSLELALDDSSLSRDLVEGGGLDGATVQAEIVNYMDLTQGSCIFLKGIVDEIEYKDKVVAAVDVNTLLSQNLDIFVENSSSNCRADLGDARCKVDIDALKKTSSVVAAANQQQFTSGLTDADDAWDWGLVLFTSGLNAGICYEVSKSLNSGGTVTLALIAAFTIAPGDTFTIYPGCDKTLGGGCTKYSNWLNFRGEPFIAAPSTVAVTTGTTPAVTTVTSTPSPNQPGSGGLVNGTGNRVII
jgi:uncharacterized phage protein (TIGR02218 family)